MNKNIKSFDEEEPQSFNSLNGFSFDYSDSDIFNIDTDRLLNNEANQKLNLFKDEEY